MTTTARLLEDGVNSFLRDLGVGELNEHGQEILRASIRPVAARFDARCDAMIRRAAVLAEKLETFRKDAERLRTLRTVALMPIPEQSELLSGLDLSPHLEDAEGFNHAVDALTDKLRDEGQP